MPGPGWYLCYISTYLLTQKQIKVLDEIKLRTKKKLCLGNPFIPFF